jgi:glycosyltransferase involved in cell wall biosynthesis
MTTFISEDKYSYFVSVIIPVFNDAKRLKICLEALEKQTYPQNFYEVIVVDNASDKEQKIEAVVAKFPQAKFTYEALSGSYVARNKGIFLAKGEVLAFTDADCIPAVDWIENGIKNLLQEPNCGLVAGKIELTFQNPTQLTIVELYESIKAFPQELFVSQYRFGATANIFTFKSVINHVGLFDASLKSSGDYEWGQRVFLSGYKQVYADDVVVVHPARYSWRQLYKKHIRIAGGQYDLQQKKYSSRLNKSLVFIITFFLELIPPFIFIISTFLDSRLQGVEQKFKVSCVLFIMKYIRVWEKLRLVLGGNSLRE